MGSPEPALLRSMKYSRSFAAIAPLYIKPEGTPGSLSPAYDECGSIGPDVSTAPATPQQPPRPKPKGPPPAAGPGRAPPYTEADVTKRVQAALELETKAREIKRIAQDEVAKLEHASKANAPHPGRRVAEAEVPTETRAALNAASVGLQHLREKRWEAEQADLKQMKEYVAKFGHGTAKLARQGKSKEKLLAKKMASGLTEKPVEELSLKFRFPDPVPQILLVIELKV